MDIYLNHREQESKAPTSGRKESVAGSTTVMLQ